MLPDAERVRELLTCLLGRQVTVSRTRNKLPVKTAHSFAAYRNDEDAIGALWTADVEAGSYLGAALSMVPPGLALEAIRKADLPETLHENLYEVVNVLASLFDTPGSPHMRLDMLVTSKDGLPTEASSLLRRPQNRLDLRIEIAGYGSGQFAFLA